jgi:hypothetical protein
MTCMHHARLVFLSKYNKYLQKPKVYKWTNPKGKIKTRHVPGLSDNSIAKEIKNIRTFMNIAIELKYTSNTPHKSKKFNTKKKETDAV